MNNIYYVIAGNPNEAFPYDRVPIAASNLYTLLSSNAILNEDDLIYIIGDTNETANSIVFNRGVNVVGISGNKVRLKTDGVGLSVNTSNLKLSNVNFECSAFGGNPLININSTNRVVVDGCTFDIIDYPAEGNIISCSASNDILLTNNRFDPTYTSGASGYSVIHFDDVKNSLITNNKFYLKGTSATGISLNGDSSYNIIRENHIIDNGQDDHITGITIQDDTKYTNIKHNAVVIGTSNSKGIYISLVDYGKTNIENNVIFITSGGNNTTIGINIEYSSTSASNSFYNIRNNIFYDNNSTSAVAISADIKDGHGIINNNNFYEFEEGSRFIYDVGNVSAINEIGDRNYFHIPNINFDVEPENYALGNFESFKLHIKNELMGLGEFYRNIGISESNYNEYINIIDTITQHFGNINDRFDDSNIYVIVNIINSLFEERANTYNNSYRNSAVVYPSDVYGNQFNTNIFESEIYSFPLIPNNELYDSDLLEIYKNKHLFSPFGNINCPPNPGFNFPTYNNYETGLFGYPRTEYINSCSQQKYPHLSWEFDQDDSVWVMY